MDNDMQPVSETVLDQIFSEAADDLDRGWKDRMIARFLKDAEAREDNELREALEPMLHQAAAEHTN